jgi:invasion protein IalB
MPAGCFTAIALKDDIVSQFSAAKSQVRIVYANAAKGEIAVPLSLKGFSQAFNALTKR